MGGESGLPIATRASEIAPGVYVGGCSDAAAFPGRRICVLDELPAAPPPAEVLLPVYDPHRDRPIRSNLDRIVQLVTEARAEGGPVLLFCGQGMRRGPLAGAWYLARSESLPLAEAYRRVQQARPQAEPASSWIGDLSPLGEDPAPASVGPESHPRERDRCPDPAPSWGVSCTDVGPTMPPESPSPPAGVPPGLVEATLTLLRRAGGPVKRRVLLRELEERGHRVSLAGLNRALDHTHRIGVTRDTPEGVVLVPAARTREP